MEFLRGSPLQQSLLPRAFFLERADGNKKQDGLASEDGRKTESLITATFARRLLLLRYVQKERTITKWVESAFM